MNAEIRDRTSIVLAGVGITGSNLPRISQPDQDPQANATYAPWQNRARSQKGSCSSVAQARGPELGTALHRERRQWSLRGQAGEEKRDDREDGEYPQGHP